ncbi:hypothetical protein D9M68_753940 [compost metagenome]
MALYQVNTACRHPEVCKLSWEWIDQGAGVWYERIPDPGRVWRAPREVGREDRRRACGGIEQRGIDGDRRPAKTAPEPGVPLWEAGRAWPDYTAPDERQCKKKAKIRVADK